MQLTSPARSAFEHDEPFAEDPLLEAASAFCRHNASDPANGELVIVLQPTTEPFVVSANGTCVLRAAVSVAAVAENHRLWAGAPVGETCETPTRSMPQVIASAADASRVRAAHTGRIEVDGVDEVIAIWFEGDEGVAAIADRRFALAALTDAATRAVAIRPDPKPAEPLDAEGAAGPREFDPNDPMLDSTTGLLTAERFDEVVATLDCAQASLIVIDLGGDVTEDGALALADRLSEAFGRNDVLTRLADDRFAVLSTEIERGEMVGHARDLLELLEEPLVDGEQQLLATIALAHEVGFVDLEDMLDTAGAAADEARRSGCNRLVLAA